MATNLKIAAILFGGLFSLGAVAEDVLRDPTRPAFELIPGIESDAVSAPAAPQGLQSVILSSRRKAAIINGTKVEVGQKYGDSVLTVVNETCVVLTGPQGRQVMHMFPTVNLSKTQLACTGRNALSSIRKTSKASFAKTVPVKPVRKTKTRKSKPVKKSISTCGCAETKKGSEK